MRGAGGAAPLAPSDQVVLRLTVREARMIAEEAAARIVLGKEVKRKGVPERRTKREGQGRGSDTAMMYCLEAL